MFTLCSLLSSRSFWRYKNIFANHTLDLKKELQLCWNPIFLETKNMCLPLFFCFPNLSPPKTTHHPTTPPFSIPTQTQTPLTMAISTKPTNQTNQPTNGRSGRTNQETHHDLDATGEFAQLRNRISSTVDGTHTGTRTEGQPVSRWPKLEAEAPLGKSWNIRLGCVCLMMMVPLGYKVSNSPIAL